MATAAEIDEAQVLELWQSGVPINEIARRFHTARRRIQAICQTAGYVKRDLSLAKQTAGDQAREMGYHSLDEALASLAQSATIAEMARRLGVPRMTMHDWLAERGIILSIKHKEICQPVTTMRQPAVRPFRGVAPVVGSDEVPIAAPPTRTCRSVELQLRVDLAILEFRKFLISRSAEVPGAVPDP